MLSALPCQTRSAGRDTGYARANASANRKIVDLCGYGANFDPHAHALVSDGVFNRDGEFLPLPAPDPDAVMEVFRRLFLERLHRAERLSETFMHNPLSWVDPGFSVFAGPALGKKRFLGLTPRHVSSQNDDMSRLN